MGRQYANASGYGEIVSPSADLVSGLRPMTAMVWMKVNTVSDDQYIYMSRHATLNDGWRFHKQSGGSGDLLHMTFFGVADKPAITSTIDDTNWHLVCVRINGSNNVAFCIDATIETIGTNMNADCDITDVPLRFSSAGRDTASPQSDANQCEHTVWATTFLTDLEIGALSRGVNPFLIQNEDCALYSPDYGNNDPENDYDAQQDQPDLFGTTTKDIHPPVELIENFI